MDKKKINLVRPLYMIIILAVMIFMSIVVAFYIMEDKKSSVIDAKKFYFSSDLLKEETKKANYYIDPMANSISFDLYNYADSKRVSAVDIEYSIEVNGGHIVGSEPGKLSTSDKKNTIYINPIENSMIVTVTSTKPYEKKLMATFNKGLGNQYEIDDKSGNTAAVLTMTCVDDAKDITIELPNTVLPDVNDDRVSNYDNTNGQCTYRSSGKGVYSLVLLKKDKSKQLSASGDFANMITISAN